MKKIVSRRVTVIFGEADSGVFGRYSAGWVKKARNILKARAAHGVRWPPGGCTGGSAGDLVAMFPIGGRAAH